MTYNFQSKSYEDLLIDLDLQAIKRNLRTFSSLSFLFVAVVIIATSHLFVMHLNGFDITTILMWVALSLIAVYWFGVWIYENYRGLDINGYPLHRYRWVLDNPARLKYEFPTYLEKDKAMSQLYETFDPLSFYVILNVNYDTKLDDSFDRDMKLLCFVMRDKKDAVRARLML